MEKRTEFLVEKYLRGETSSEQEAELSRIIKKGKSTFPDLEMMMNDISSYKEHKPKTDPKIGEGSLVLDQLLKQDFRGRPSSLANIKIVGIHLILLALLLTTVVFAINNHKTHRREISGLTEKITTLENLMVLNFITPTDASDKIQIISQNSLVQKPDERIIRALSTILNEDNNINVRLAAAKALYRYPESAMVRMELLKALSLQDNPITQITLIEMLTSLGERAVIKQLRALIKDENTVDVVKSKAQSSLNFLL